MVGLSKAGQQEIEGFWAVAYCSLYLPVMWQSVSSGDEMLGKQGLRKRFLLLPF